MSGGVRRVAPARSRLAAVLAGLALTLAACATAPTGAPGPAPAPPAEPAPPPAAPPAAGISPASLPGWNEEDHLAAFEAWTQGCGVARDPSSQTQCERARELQRTSRPVTPSLARAYFETGFTVAPATKLVP